MTHRMHKSQRHALCALRSAQRRGAKRRAAQGPEPSSRPPTPCESGLGQPCLIHGGLFSLHAGVLAGPPRPHKGMHWLCTLQPTLSALCIWARLSPCVSDWLLEAGSVPLTRSVCFQTFARRSSLKNLLLRGLTKLNMDEPVGTRVHEARREILVSVPLPLWPVRVGRAGRVRHLFPFVRVARQPAQRSGIEMKGVTPPTSSQPHSVAAAQAAQAAPTTTNAGVHRLSAIMHQIRDGPTKRVGSNSSTGPPTVTGDAMPAESSHPHQLRQVHGRAPLVRPRPGWSVERDGS